MPLAKRPRMEDIIEENSTPAEIQAYNRQWPRFGPGAALGRAFRFTQTRSAITQKTCLIKHVVNAWQMNKKGGDRLLEKISDTKNEKLSKN